MKSLHPKLLSVLGLLPIWNIQADVGAFRHTAFAWFPIFGLRTRISRRTDLALQGYPAYEVRNAPMENREELVRRRVLRAGIANPHHFGNPVICHDGENDH